MQDLFSFGDFLSECFRELRQFSPWQDDPQKTVPLLQGARHKTVSLLEGARHNLRQLPNSI